MLKMLEQLELTVRPLGQDGRAEGFHDFLDGNILAGKLILCRAGTVSQMAFVRYSLHHHILVPPGQKTYQTSPKAPMPTGCKSEYLR